VCVCVCVYECMYVCVCVYIYIYIYNWSKFYQEKDKCVDQSDGMLEVYTIMV